MSKFVTVVPHPVTGEVVTQGKPGFGKIRVDSEPQFVVTGNFGQFRKRTAFIAGKLEDLQNFKAGQKIPGIIQRQTSSQPFYPDQTPVTNPTTGEVLDKYQQFVFLHDVNAPLSVEIIQEAEATVPVE